MRILENKKFIVDTSKKGVHIKMRLLIQFLIIMISDEISSLLYESSSKQICPWFSLLSFGEGLVSCLEYPTLTFHVDVLKTIDFLLFAKEN